MKFLYMIQEPESLAFPGKLRKVSDYLVEFFEIVDSLAMAGDKMDRDITLYTLARLGDNYETFIQSFITQDYEALFVKLTILSDVEI